MRSANVTRETSKFDLWGMGGALAAVTCRPMGLRAPVHAQGNSKRTLRAGINPLWWARVKGAPVVYPINSNTVEPRAAARRQFTVEVVQSEI